MVRLLALQAKLAILDVVFLRQMKCNLLMNYAVIVNFEIRTFGADRFAVLHLLMHRVVLLRIKLSGSRIFAVNNFINKLKSIFISHDSVYNAHFRLTYANHELFQLVC